MNIEQLRKEYSDILKFVNTGKSSLDDYKSVNVPFCEKLIDKQPILLNLFNESLQTIDELEIPSTLKKIYQIISNTKVEYYFDKWILYSMDWLKERYVLYKSKNQNRIIDFFYIYIGMGHIIVVSVDPLDKKILFRRDGGSNGYEREINWNNICKFIPNEKDKHDFSIWFTMVKSQQLNILELFKLCITYN